MVKPDFDALGLDNSEYVEGTNTIDRTDLSIRGSASGSTSEIPYVEVFERYGYIPEFVRTGKESDRNKYFYAHVIVSGLNGTPIVHLVEEVDEDAYGEGKLKEIPNRHDGRGIPEMLFNIQAYVNEIINTRMNKSRIVQLGLFKLTGNVTPQQFKRLFTTGGIKLDASSNITPLDTGTVDTSTYKDEEQAYLWSTRVTGTTNTDEVAGNKPATNALIEDRSTSKGYGLRIEELMLELGEFIKKKVIPIIKEELKNDVGKIERITGDPEVLNKLDVAFAKNKVNNELSQMDEVQRGMLVDKGITEDVLVKDEIGRIKSAYGNDRYLPIVEELLDTDYDVEIVLSDESINRTAMATMLQSTLGILASSGMPIRNTIKELYDTLGLDGETLIQDMPEQGQAIPGQQQVQQVGAPAQEIANTIAM